LAKFSSTPRISSIQTTIARDLRLRQQHWDVGSLLQEAVSECLYVAFEPDPATFATLRRNVYQNHLSDAELHSVAIGDHSGQIELFRDPSPESSSLRMSTLRQRHDGPSVAVQLRRLSDFIRSDIDLLKIDVEGAEDAALGDLAGSGKLRYAKRLHLEYHHHIDASADKLSSMLRLIEENGFGYQLRAIAKPWPVEASFQDISIYCYRK
jgi:FkbM family methyltransferase